MPKIFTNTPPKTPDIKAASGLYHANVAPIKPYVAIIESTPVCGVDIKNETAVESEAPFSFKYNPVGTTPHEHNGNGTPSKLALMIDHRLFLPR